MRLTMWNVGALSVREILACTATTTYTTYLTGIVALLPVLPERTPLLPAAPRLPVLTRRCAGTGADLLFWAWSVNQRLD